jgi:hypothetical protein
VEKFVGRGKNCIPWYLFGARAQERGRVALVYTALSFRSFRAILSRAFFLVQTVLLSEFCMTRFER